MASSISAGNATNGLAISSDNTGILELKTGTGAGTTAITLDASQNVTFAGTITQPTGTTYPLVSRTAQTASGTAVDFTGIPAWVKRITVMFNGVSTNGTSAIIVQAGSGSITTSGYGSGGAQVGGTNAATGFSAANGLLSGGGGGAVNIFFGTTVLNLVGSNFWVSNSFGGFSNVAFGAVAGGGITLSGTLDRVRITTVNGTDTFDAGSINILYE